MYLRSYSGSAEKARGEGSDRRVEKHIDFVPHSFLSRSRYHMTQGTSTPVLHVHSLSFPWDAQSVPAGQMGRGSHKKITEAISKSQYYSWSQHIPHWSHMCLYCPIKHDVQYLACRTALIIISVPKRQLNTH